MTVIGYVVQCATCGQRMVVTVDGRHEKYCPDCLRLYVEGDIDSIVESNDEPDHIPPWQVHG